MNAYDYIIIGAGSAGCVIANRLSSDPSVRVALLEAGPSDRRFPASFKTKIPVGNIFLLPHDKYNWKHEFSGGAAIEGRKISCPRGKILGGSSSVNGSVYMRGHRKDYDDWAALGNPGWSYADVLPWFKRHERRHAAPSPYHGADGELDVMAPMDLNPLSAAFVDAAVAVGHSRSVDFNGETQDGFAAFELNQRSGTRLSSSRAFLHPILDRPNLTVITDALVHSIDLQGGRACGVTAVIGGVRRQLSAACEVVLCAGAINSPQLLLLSGIGPEAHLRKHGIAVLHHLPGVGRNLQDHPSVAVSRYNPSGESYALTPHALPRIALSPFQYLVNHTGMLSTNAAEAGGFFRTRPELDRPDAQITFMVGLKTAALSIPRQHGMMAIVTVLRPATRGHIELASPRAQDRPLLHPAFLEDDKDVRTLIAGLREARKILQAAPISAYVGAEILPGADLQSDEQLEAMIRRNLTTVYHPVGTCKMGPAQDPLAVVDAELRLHGIDGLRVADASIFPNIVGGNTAAPATMIGERAAAFIGAGKRS